MSPLPAALSPRRHVKKKKYSMYARDVRARSLASRRLAPLPNCGPAEWDQCTKSTRHHSLHPVTKHHTSILLLNSHWLGICIPQPSSPEPFHATNYNSVAMGSALIGLISVKKTGHMQILNIFPVVPSSTSFTYSLSVSLSVCACLCVCLYAHLPGCVQPAVGTDSGCCLFLDISSSLASCGEKRPDGSCLW